MRQGAVHGGNIPHLLGDICMTGRTAIGHGLGFPQRDMTGFALAARLGMRSDPTHCSSSLCTQRTRVIHQPAARVGIPRDRKGGDQRGNDPYSGETT